jgi:WD40 repeat protein
MNLSELNINSEKIINQIRNLNDKISNVQNQLNQIQKLLLKDTNLKIPKLSQIQENIDYKEPKSYQNLDDFTINSNTSSNKYDVLCVFKSANNILYLVYPNKNIIIFYNLIDKKKVSEIRNAHDYEIIHISHLYDEKKNLDLLMSASNDVKIWNLDNKECINNIRIFNGQSIYCSFLKHITGIYCLVGICYYQKNSINAYYYNKGLAKKFIIEEKSEMYCLKTYNSNDSKNYILVGLYDLALSIDFNTGLIDDFREQENGKCHRFLNIFEEDNIIKLIDGCHECINIWNFHNRNLLMKIYLDDIYSLCVWNNSILLVGGEKKIYIINLNYGIILNEIFGHNKVINIKKFVHPLYGSCLISQGEKNDFIFVRKVN